MTTTRTYPSPRHPAGRAGIGARRLRRRPGRRGGEAQADRRQPRAIRAGEGRSAGRLQVTRSHAVLVSGWLRGPRRQPRRRASHGAQARRTGVQAVRQRVVSQKGRNGGRRGPVDRGDQPAGLRGDPHARRAGRGPGVARPETNAARLVHIGRRRRGAFHSGPRARRSGPARPAAHLRLRSPRQSSIYIWRRGPIVGWVFSSDILGDFDQQRTLQLARTLDARIAR